MGEVCVTECLRRCHPNRRAARACLRAAIPAAEVAFRHLAGDLRGDRGFLAADRALLTSHDAAVRIRAALAVGRIGVAEAAGTLRRMLDDPEAGEMAAWALGRIDGGRDALISCLAERCPASRAAARPLSGPVAFKQPAMEALIAALSGPAADDAAFSLGVLARNKDGKGLRQRN